MDRIGLMAYRDWAEIKEPASDVGRTKLFTSNDEDETNYHNNEDNYNNTNDPAATKLYSPMSKMLDDMYSSFKQFITESDIGGRTDGIVELVKDEINMLEKKGKKAVIIVGRLTIE